MPKKRIIPRKYTDDEISAMDNVPPEIAGAYIGKSTQYVRWCLQDGVFPVGSARFHKRWAYHIPGPALVRYKNYGIVSNENDNSAVCL